MTVATAIRIDGPMMPARRRVWGANASMHGDQRIDESDHDLVGNAWGRTADGFTKVPANANAG